MDVRFMDIDGDPAFGTALLDVLHKPDVFFGETECVQCIMLHYMCCTVYMKSDLILCEIDEHEADMRIFKNISHACHHTVSTVFRIDERSVSEDPYETGMPCSE